MLKALETCERYFTPVGRIILGAFFVINGLGKLADVAGTASYIESVGFPAGTILAILAIILEVGVGGALMVGYQARYSALILAAFTLFVSFPFHGPGSWAEMPMQQILFMKNIAIVGGLLFMAAHIGAPCCKVAKTAERTAESPAPAL